MELAKAEQTTILRVEIIAKGISAEEIFAESIFQFTTLIAKICYGKEEKATSYEKTMRKKKYKTRCN